MRRWYWEGDFTQKWGVGKNRVMIKHPLLWPTVWSFSSNAPQQTFIVSFDIRREMILLWCLILTHVCFGVEDSGFSLHWRFSYSVSCSCCNTQDSSPVASSLIDIGFSRKSEKISFLLTFCRTKKTTHNEVNPNGCLTQNCWVMKSYNSTPWYWSGYLIVWPHSKHTAFLFDTWKWNCKS